MDDVKSVHDAAVMWSGVMHVFRKGWNFQAFFFPVYIESL